MPNEMSVKEIVAKLEGPWGCDIVFWNHDLGALQADVLALVADWRKRGAARAMLEKDLDVLSASHKDLAHRVAEMGKALNDIAQQKLIEEYAAEADPNTGDWEGAYDACVRRARAALPPKP